MNTPHDPSFPSLSTRSTDTQSAYLISLRLTPEQHRWLENTAAFITNETGHPASHSSILMRLLELGLPSFEQEMEALRIAKNSDKKRFHKLQLAYSAPKQA
jgi:hypothetical protein